ncbi:ParB N-terminal domain-containing protein [Haloarcula sp. JP-Z28]|uniref:ParB/RepB/Spo0J family partition protein n=1 Tax=Haloarcula sp. JP-Z28 TaxID=2716715 RepID=UPI001404EF91|nr:ParB N-terminal domain-containing protein [Haloarcula sp. JP-Z28]NHN64380.1 ParB N-terminal domain-containing protein [Haloarcula sp. JP-Z28]
MNGSTATGIEVADELLPAEYDRLISVNQLIHGEHNPRRVSPTKELRASVEQAGLQQPLIVRPDDEKDDLYHITDGWQRYQAATSCGWEVLPVRIFESPLAALEETETTSIVREWSTYEWAKYCQSVATELTADSQQDLIEQVTDQTTKSAGTVRRYLDVLSLPKEIHPLLIDGPEGHDRDWAALRNYNDQVRRYDGLPWTVAEYLARRQSGLDQDRIIGIAALAVEFTQSEDAIEFIDRASDHSSKPLDIVRKEVLLGQQHPRMLEVPRVVVSLDRAKKQAIMEYCRKNRRSLTDIVTETFESLAVDAEND